MARKLIKRWMPDPDKVRAHEGLKFMEHLLHQPYLWHLTRHSACKAFLIGMFWAFVPMPFQMVPAALCALWFHANLPLSIGLVWLTNPLTMVPIWYASYKLGFALLGGEPLPESFAFTVENLTASFGMIWKPLVLGSITIGSALAIVSYLGLDYFWRWHSMRRWRQRPHAKRRQA